MAKSLIDFLQTKPYKLDTWAKPEMLILGNLKDFVQASPSTSKSGVCADGSSGGTTEQMTEASGSCQFPPQ